MPAPKDAKKYRGWIKKLKESRKGQKAWNKGKKGHPSYLKNKTYKEVFGKEKAKNLRRKLSNSHKGIKHKKKRLYSEEYKKQKSIRYAGFDVRKYKDLIIKLYTKEEKSGDYIAKYIKINFEPKSKGKGSFIISYLRKWGVPIINMGRFQKGNKANWGRSSKGINKKEPVKIKCLYCGKINNVPPSESFRKYCNVECMKKGFKGTRRSQKTEFKKGFIPSYKGKTYEERFGKEKAKQLRKNLSDKHKGIKHKKKRLYSEEYKKQKSIRYLGFDIEKYKDIITRMYNKHYPSTYIAKYIRFNYESKSKMSYSVVLTYLKKWGIKVRENKVDRRAFSWEDLCREIAEKLYKTKFKPVSLPNRKIPDWAYNRIRKDFYEIIFDAKTQPYNKSVEEDIKNYSLYCNRLEFWCLKGKRKSDNEKVEFISSGDLIKRLKEINGKRLISKILLLRKGIDICDKKQKKLEDF